ncbi:Hypothetical protein, putative [Bodo saltans]|uniref:Uncharacterized protein n=1 Tax=Bodo saltans TaxID=75058 RepID=A0A0S4ITX9_BODSA|nr:Hypothetical protein, putative [Bodo saltans]|eukprot:CUG07459.1 Hypothetical protein, putative [Bodo saltans]
MDNGASLISSSSSQYDELFRRIHELDQKLQYIERRAQDSTRHTSTQLSSIEGAAHNCASTVANVELKAAKDIERLEGDLQEMIQRESQARVDSESRLKKILADEVAAVRSSFLTQEHQRATQAQAWLHQSTELADTLRSKMDATFDHVQHQVDEVASVITDEARRVETVLSRHQSAREEAEMQLLRVLEDSCVQLHQEIVQERLERVESHKRLERLLLETVNKTWTRT